MTEKSLTPEERCLAEAAKEAIKLVSNEPEQDCVTIKAPPEDLYRLFLFCEERMADNLRMGTRMEPEQLYKLMQAMYALRDASLALQPGEVVTPSGITQA